MQPIRLETMRKEKEITNDTRTAFHLGVFTKREEEKKNGGGKNLRTVTRGIQPIHKVAIAVSGTVLQGGV